MSDCKHPQIVKRPESGPGSTPPGEWFCPNCNAWWKEWRPLLAFTPSDGPVLNEGKT